MDRIFAKDFDFAKRCGPINEPEPVYVPELVDGSDVKVQLLNAIYAIDPVTNLPTGDIACYLSPNTSPEVKQFIMDNLMIDVSGSAAPRSADMSDEDLIALTVVQKNPVRIILAVFRII